MPESIIVRKLRRKERQQLEQWTCSRTIQVGLWQRAIIILDVSKGRKLPEVAKEIRLDPVNARKWVHRFNEHGLDGLKEGVRSGRPLEYKEQIRQKVLEIATSKPADLNLPFTTWSLPKLRDYLREQNIAPEIGWTTIRRILREAGWAYYSSRTWCESNDPEFEEKKTI